MFSWIIPHKDNKDSAVVDSSGGNRLDFLSSLHQCNENFGGHLEFNIIFVQNCNFLCPERQEDREGIHFTLPQRINKIGSTTNKVIRGTLRHWPVDPLCDNQEDLGSEWVLAGCSSQTSALAHRQGDCEDPWWN